jgi:hypothetical protein
MQVVASRNKKCPGLGGLGGAPTQAWGILTAQARAEVSISGHAGSQVRDRIKKRGSQIASAAAVRQASAQQPSCAAIWYTPIRFPGGLPQTAQARLPCPVNSPLKTANKIIRTDKRNARAARFVTPPPRPLSFDNALHSKWLNKGPTSKSSPPQIACGRTACPKHGHAASRRQARPLFIPPIVLVLALFGDANCKRIGGCGTFSIG